MRFSVDRICPNCHHVGAPRRRGRGDVSALLWVLVLGGVLLWGVGPFTLLVLLTALVHTVWRSPGNALTCPECDYPNMVTLGSPRGKELRGCLDESEPPTPAAPPPPVTNVITAAAGRFTYHIEADRKLTREEMKKILWEGLRDGSIAEPPEGGVSTFRLTTPHQGDGEEVGGDGKEPARVGRASAGVRKPVLVAALVILAAASFLARNRDNAVAPTSEEIDMTDRLPQQMPRPMTERANYFLLALEPDDSFFKTVHKRVSPAAVGYSMTRIDCATRRY